MEWAYITADPEEHKCFACGTPDAEPPWFKLCLECAHTWKTAGDLMHHDYSVRIGLDPMAKPRPVKDIYACPCCAHDF